MKNKILKTITIAATVLTLFGILTYDTFDNTNIPVVLVSVGLGWVGSFVAANMNRL
jgi:hypothetical protein